MSKLTKIIILNVHNKCQKKKLKINNTKYQNWTNKKIRDKTNINKSIKWYINIFIIRRKYESRIIWMWSLWYGSK